MPLNLVAEAQVRYDETLVVPMKIDFTAVIDHLTDEQFFQFCVANRDLRIERKANGETVIMPPEGGATASRNSIDYRSPRRLGGTQWRRNRVRTIGRFHIAEHGDLRPRRRLGSAGSPGLTLAT